MKIVSGRWPVLIALTLLSTTYGCATSEREAAKKLDMTQEISEQALSLFAADAELSHYPIKIDGFKGDMRLRGSVATDKQKTRAEKIVWALRGVKSVGNQLELQAERPTAPKSRARP